MKYIFQIRAEVKESRNVMSNHPDRIKKKGGLLVRTCENYGVCVCGFQIVSLGVNGLKRYWNDWVKLWGGCIKYVRFLIDGSKKLIPLAPIINFPFWHLEEGRN